MIQTHLQIGEGSEERIFRTSTKVGSLSDELRQTSLKIYAEDEKAMCNTSCSLN